MAKAASGRRCRKAPTSLSSAGNHRSQVGGFWSDVWASFKAAFGPVLTGAAFLLALLGPLYAPTAVIQVSVVWAGAGCLLGLTFLWTAVNMVVQARRAVQPQLPRVRHVMLSEGRGLDAATTILVLARSELFGVNILVTIYYSEALNSGHGESIERPIGTGRVVNVQQNGLIQVVVLAEVPEHTDLWQRVRNREPAVLAQLLVKPSIFADSAGIEVRLNE